MVWLFNSGPSGSLDAFTAAHSGSAANDGPGLLARGFVGKARHIGETAIFVGRGERANQFDAVTGKKPGRDIVGKATRIASARPSAAS